MSHKTLGSMVSRLFFGGAFVLLVLVVMERIAYETGYTILRGRGTHLLEDAAVLLMFVIAFQLRELREELRVRKL